jgi:hypothetical protein
VPFDHGGDERLDLRGLRDVGSNEVRVTARLPDGVGRLLATLRIDVGDDDLRAFAREEARRCLADARASAGDEGDLVRKPVRNRAPPVDQPEETSRKPPRSFQP